MKVLIVIQVCKYVVHSLNNSTESIWAMKSSHFLYQHLNFEIEIFAWNDCHNFCFWKWNAIIVHLSYYYQIVRPMEHNCSGWSEYIFEYENDRRDIRQSSIRKWFGHYKSWFWLGKHCSRTTMVLPSRQTLQHILPNKVQTYTSIR